MAARVLLTMDEAVDDESSEACFGREMERAFQLFTIADQNRDQEGEAAALLRCLSPHAR